MDTKSFPSRINSYLVLIPQHLGDVLRLFVALTLFATAACTENKTINQTNPPVSQAGGQTRTSDPDGWGGGSTGDGGGGQGVYCSAAVADARLKDRLIVRDVYEAEFNYKMPMTGHELGPAGTTEVVPESYEFLIKTLSRYYGPMMFFEKVGKLGYWQDFVKAISYIPQGVQLKPSQDANSPMALPTGCELVQIAYWSEASGSQTEGVLFVDQASWKKLDQFNKVALLAHEHFFKRARMAGAKNSDYVREKLGKLFSVEGLPAMFQDWAPSKDPKVKGLLPESSKGFKVCQGIDHSRRGNIVLYQYQDKSERQTLVWSNVRAGDKEMRPFESVFQRIENNFELYNEYAAVTDYLYGRGKAKGVEEKDKLGVSFFDKDLNLTQTGKSILELGESIPGPSFLTFTSEGSISLVNPIYGYVPPEKREILPRETLLNRIYTGALEAFLDNPEKEKVLERTQALQALSVLDKEIDEGQKSGVYPTGFPKWAAAVQGFEKAGLKLSDFERSYLYNLVPTGLYVIKYGYYTYKDVNAVLGRDGFVEMTKPIDELVSVSIDDKKFSYFMTCYSYQQVYYSITHSQAATPQQKEQ